MTRARHQDRLTPELACSRPALTENGGPRMGAEPPRPITEEAEALNLLAELRLLVAEHFVPARGFLNLKQAALYLGGSPGTLREWIRAKRLPFYKPGKELLFKRHELDQWMDRHRKVAGSL